MECHREKDRTIDEPGCRSDTANACTRLGAEKDVEHRNQTVVRDVADSEGLCIVKVNCDGGAECRGRFQALYESLGIIIQLTPRTSLKEMPLPSADLAPSLILRAASSWGRLTSRQLRHNSSTPSDVYCCFDGFSPQLG